MRFLYLLLLFSLSLAQRSIAEQAAILDPTVECQYHAYAPVTAMIPTYPKLYETASMSFAGVLPADLAIWNSIRSSIPKIAPKGDRTGNLAGMKPYPASDPDCWWTSSKCTTPKIPGIPADITRCSGPNTLGFTLDDGPSCAHNQFFNYLDSVSQKATLFYIGSNVLTMPLEAQRGLTDGHEICAHTWSHPFTTSLSDEQLFAELYYSKKAIYDVLGVSVACWRPPSGDVDDRVRFVANFLGMKTILWQFDSSDWKHGALGIPAVQANYDAVIALASKGTYSTQGTILLSHELDLDTMSLVQKNLPALNKAFSGGVMPVAVCMNNTQPYYSEPGYTYPNAAQWIAGTRSISLSVPTAGLHQTPMKLSTSDSSSVATSYTSAPTSTAVETGISTSSESKSTFAISTATVITSVTSTPTIRSSGSNTSGASIIHSGFFGIFIFVFGIHLIW